MCESYPHNKIPSEIGDRKMKRRKKENWEVVQGELLDTIFDIAYNLHGWSTNRLAKQAGLAWSTIERLYVGQTRRPQFRTIVLLSNTVGMDVRLVKKTLGKAAA